MDFIWDEDKNDWLKTERFISFEEIVERIQAHQYRQIIENPAKPSQRCFILPIREYTWVVPFVFDEKERIVLKTAYPSRKFHRLYGGEPNHDRNETD